MSHLQKLARHKCSGQAHHGCHVSAAASGWLHRAGCLAAVCRSTNNLAPHLHKLAWQERSGQGHNGCHALAAALAWPHLASPIGLVCWVAHAAWLQVMTMVVLVPVAPVVPVDADMVDAAMVLCSRPGVARLV